MLNLEQINLLGNDAKNKYMALERLFDQPGYKYLIGWAKAQSEECVVRILHAQNWDQHTAWTGAKHAYDNFVNLEQLTEQEFATEAETNRLQAERDQEEKELEIAGENE